MTFIVHRNSVRCSELLCVLKALTTGKYRLKSTPTDILSYKLFWIPQPQQFRKLLTHFCINLRYFSLLVGSSCTAMFELSM